MSSIRHPARTFLARVGCVRRVDRDPRAGALTNLVRRPRVVAIGDQNPRDRLPRQLRQIFVTGLHEIDGPRNVRDLISSAIGTI